MRRVRTLGSDAGFSVTEFVYAAAILFVVAMGVLAAMTFAAQSTQASAIRVTALNVANQKLEQIRNLPYDNIGTISPEGTLGSPPGSVLTRETLDGRFTVDTVVRWARDPATGRALYKEVVVDVSWSQGVGGTVSVASNVFGKSNLINTGDLSIDVLDRDTNLPVEGARVSIVRGTGAPVVVSSDAQGKVFFGYLPTGTYTVDIDAAGYIFDPTSAGTVEVTADLLTTVVAYVQHPSAVRVSATDGVSPVPGASVTLTLGGLPPVTIVTGGDGVALFENLVIGTYGLHAEALGRSTVDMPVNVAAGGTTYEVLVPMPAREGLAVRVLDGSGAPVPGASVSVQGPAPSTAHVSGSPGVTTSSGEISFGYPVDGTYTIIARKTGYVTVTTTVIYDGTVGLWEVSLVPPVVGSMEIRTERANGNAVGNEWVTVTGADYYLRVRSDSSGLIALSSLTVGSYQVRSERTGDSNTVQVMEGQTSLVSVRCRD